MNGQRVGNNTGGVIVMICLGIRIAETISRTADYFPFPPLPALHEMHMQYAVPLDGEPAVDMRCSFSFLFSLSLLLNIVGVTILCVGCTERNAHAGGLATCFH